MEFEYGVCNQGPKMTPESLKGIYAPIHLGVPFIYFINNAKMNIHHGNKIINLIDLFPMLKSGYALKNTLTLLMYSYSNINELRQGQFVKTDEIMNKAFNSDIPAQYFIGPNNSKMLMDEAIGKGLISQSLNTFESVKLRNANFNCNEFKNYFIQCFQMFNVTKLTDDVLENKEFTDELCREYELITEICRIAKTKHLNMSLVWMISIEKLNKSNILITYLVDNEYVTSQYIKLINSIVGYDIVQIEELLMHVDPRDHYNEIYYLAIETNDTIIINKITKNIIERSWYEKQVFDTYINSIHGCISNLPTILYSKSRAIL